MAAEYVKLHSKKEYPGPKQHPYIRIQALILHREPFGGYSATWRACGLFPVILPEKDT
ncbi:MAG: hypothetical protein KH271_01425 [Clostridiales bacterium]|nr:hypothetical protein [Clostridiales bacterium]MCB7334736.1 hypothetical protein [Enterocloster aldenensis]